MLTRILKNNNLEQLNIHIENKNIYNFQGIANTAITCNNFEAFKIIYNKFLSLPKMEHCIYDLLHKVLFTSVNYGKFNFINFIVAEIKNRKIDINSEDIELLFGSCVSKIKIIKVLQESFILRKSYIPYMIFRLNNTTNKKNKKSIYKITDFLISVYGSFPSKEVFKVIKKHDAFSRINYNSIKSDFIFSDYLFKYDKDNYIIRNFNALLKTKNNELFYTYENLQKLITLSEKINTF